jgi:tetratricopeptide (TPR) repeat protein
MKKVILTLVIQLLFLGSTFAQNISAPGSGLDIKTEKKYYFMLAQAHKYLDSLDVENAVKYFTKSLEIKPDGYEANLEMGKILSSLGEYDEAIMYLSKALEKKPEDFEPNYELGVAYYFIFDLENSIFFYKKSIEKNPENSKAFFGLGITYLYDKKYDEALAFLSKAKLLNQDDELPLYYIALAYTYKREFDKSLMFLEEYLEKTTSDHAAYMFAGDICNNLDYPEKSNYYFKQAFRLKPDDLKTNYSLGLSFLRFSNPQTDSASYYMDRCININPEAPSAYYIKGKLLVIDENFHKGRPYLEKAVELTTGYAYPYYYLALCDLNDNDPKAAMDNLKKAIAYDTNYFSALNKLAEIYFYDNNFNEAVKYFKKAYKTNNNSVSVNYNLGISLYMLKDYSGSLKYFKNIHKLYPDDIDINLWLGRSYHHSGLKPLAVNFFNKVISDGKDKEKIAFAYTFLGEFDKAKKLMSELIEEEQIKSYKQEVYNKYYNLACMASIANKKTDAINALKQSVELGFDDFSYMLIDPDFDNIKDSKEFNRIINSAEL